MKRNYYSYLIALCLAINLLGACSNEDEFESIVAPQDSKETEKVQDRFAEPPFVWDYTYSTDKIADSVQIFIGDLEIISKSRITLFIISDDDPNGHTFYTLDNIKNSFNLSYSLYNPGYPVFCQGNYTKDNSAFYLKSSSGVRPVVHGNGGSIRRSSGGSGSSRRI